MYPLNSLSMDFLGMKTLCECVSLMLMIILPRVDGAYICFLHIFAQNTHVMPPVRARNYLIYPWNGINREIWGMVFIYPDLNKLFSSLLKLGSFTLHHLTPF